MFLAQATAVLVLTVPTRADDLEAAKAQFLKSCGTCHSVEPGAAPRQGPNLHGVIGRKAGTLPGFTYSPALQSWGEVWTEDLLEPWITNAQLTEIMLAQDFQDLTGQVIKRVVEMVQNFESQLLQVLIESMPEDKRAAAPGGLMNGPVIGAAGRSDVVTSQAQVDDLLESLGF